MASIKQLSSGNWRVQVRRKQCYASETFRRHEDAKRWALAVERSIDLGETPSRRSKVDPTTFGHLIDLHRIDMCEVGRAPSRSKAFTLDTLQDKLGKVRIKDLTRERLIQFGKDRAREGAGPVTIGMDLGYIKLVIAHAAAVHGLQVSPEPVVMARLALKRLGLVGKGRERDRRPTLDEIDRLLSYVDGNFRQIIPIGRIVRFAIATAMRQEEICTIRWADVDRNTKTVAIRGRKDPRNKEGNDQRVPLLDASGIDAWAILEEQWPFSRHTDRVFPYNSRSVGTAFRRACKELKIDNLRFHDLRHEGASRLFEAGFSIEQVALVTGHRDWKMLKRYTNLRPESLHDMSRARGPRAGLENRKNAARQHPGTQPAPLAAVVTLHPSGGGLVEPGLASYTYMDIKFG